MSNASRFLFDRDFGAPQAAGVKHAAELQTAEERGFAQGVLEGQRAARAETQTRLCEAAESLAGRVLEIMARADQDRAELEDDAIAFALALGRKLAGEALRSEPLAAIAEAAKAAFSHVRGVPHLAVRVNEALLEDVETLVKRLARERGFEGRLIVLGEPDIAPGDARLEWADGGIVRDQARIEEAVARALTRSR